MPVNGSDGTPKLAVRPVTAERWADLEQLFGPRGAYSGCWCTWWQLSRSEFSRYSAAERKQVLQGIVASGQVPGVLAYLDERPVAWCSIGPRESYPGLERSRILARVDDRPVWSIVCFFVAREYRRRGLLVPLIQAAVEYAAQQGARIVEAYPVDPHGQAVEAVRSFTGLAPAFERAGFVEVSRRSDRRPIMRCVIAPAP
jgi:GNAT superfamily N-acetyltransferase